jgi:predicted SprT family Zn-dependent metalloprotease
MRPTISYIQQKFEEFNQLCFEGKLLPLPFKLSRARTYLGQIAYKRRRKFSLLGFRSGGVEYYDFVFRISTLLDLPQEEVDDTILHEMIHYYILSNQLKDTSTHGKLFRSIMNDINTKFGRHITISHRRTKEEYEQDTCKRQHLICVMEMEGGKRGICIAAKTRLLSIWDTTKLVPAIRQAQWYLSHNFYFNRYPRCLSLKVYPITEDVLQQQLQDARPLIRQGSRIIVGRSVD